MPCAVFVAIAFVVTGKFVVSAFAMLLTRTVNGQPQSITTNYKYDANNRLTETDYADGTKAQVQYNSIGKQSATIDQLGQRTSYTYDTMGRLTTTT